MWPNRIYGELLENGESLGENMSKRPQTGRHWSGLGMKTFISARWRFIIVQRREMLHKSCKY
jgi:hypothetical protein